jgi:hypothetical protein
MCVDGAIPQPQASPTLGVLVNLLLTCSEPECRRGARKETCTGTGGPAFRTAKVLMNCPHSAPGWHTVCQLEELSSGYRLQGVSQLLNHLKVGGTKMKCIHHLCFTNLRQPKVEVGKTLHEGT